MRDTNKRWAIDVLIMVVIWTVSLVIYLKTGNWFYTIGFAALAALPGLLMSPSKKVE